MHRALTFALAVLLTACAPSSEGEGEAGEGEAGEGEAGEGEGEGDAFALTSTAFAEGGAIPDAFTCNGENVSPPLAWTGAPSGTAGFALVLTDLTIALVHAALWDIDEASTSLPQGVENAFSPSDVDGAHQSFAYDGVTRGWLGPCPPNEHTYELKLFALNARPLPGLDESSSADDVKAACEAAAVGAATLTATYAP